jgi:hypothetical protein
MNDAPDSWVTIESEADLYAAHRRGGYVVIVDDATDRGTGGPKYHHPDCPFVRQEHFEQKVIEGGGRTGRYFWAASEEVARAHGARPCQHPADPLSAGNT